MIEKQAGTYHWFFKLGRLSGGISSKPVWGDGGVICAIYFPHGYVGYGFHCLVFCGRYLHLSWLGAEIRPHEFEVRTVGRWTVGPVQAVRI